MTGETTPFDVLYRDRDVIVANKRPGLLSQPDAGGDPDLLSLLSREYGGPVYPVHRLDRGVGGLIAVASSERAARLRSRLSRPRSSASSMCQIWCVTSGVRLPRLVLPKPSM